MNSQIKKSHILIVDDDLQIRIVLRKRIEGLGHTVDEAEDGAKGFNKIKKTDYDLVLTDVQMPLVDGLEMVQKVRQLNTELPVVVVISGHSDINKIREAMQRGAHDYLIKPFGLHELDMTLQRALEKNHLIRENIDYRINLEKKVQEQTEEIQRRLQQLEEANNALRVAYESTVKAFSNALDARDRNTQDHVTRVSEYVVKIAKAMGFSEVDIATLKWGAILHDIGKIGIPDSILLKEGQLNEEERIIMERHLQIGYEMLKNIAFLKDVLPIVVCHQEKYDGTGYPRGLKGEDIPIGARIFAVADAYDAMTSDRPYRKAMSQKDTIEELMKYSGKQFDPKILNCFLTILENETS